MRQKIEQMLEDYEKHFDDSETLIEQCILLTIINDLKITLKDCEFDAVPLFTQVGLEEVKVPDFLRKQAE